MSSLSPCFQNWQDYCSEEENFGLGGDVGLLPETPFEPCEHCFCLANLAVDFGG